MTDPPLLSVAVLSVVRRRAAVMINWLHDIYPEVAVASGILWLKGPIGRLLVYLRDRSLKAARVNVVVGERMADYLSARGVPTQSIRFISNFADDDTILPVVAAENPLRRQWNLSEKFVVGYSGNLGRVHEFETILGAALRLRNDSRIVFLCIGGGRLFEALAEAAQQRGLKEKFLFHPYQHRDVLKYSLSVPDVHWVSLRPEFEGLVVPSKFYGAAAAGRPIVAIATKTGEIATLVRRYHCGLSVEPGDIDALAESLTLLMNDPSLCAAMGARARAMVETQFTKQHAIHSWAKLIEGLRDGN